MSATDEPGAIHESLDVVLFQAGNWRIGFEASRVRASRPAAADAVDGEIQALLGIPTESATTSSTTRHQYLQLKRPDGDREIVVGGPVELVSLKVEAIHPLPPLLAARTQLHGLRALTLPTANKDKVAVLLFDADLRSV